ncbi:MAG: hypothetical protein WCC04_04105 [Terriglobales bacterium]
MLGPIAKHRSIIIFLALFVIGAVLIGLSNTFQYEWMKVRVDRLVAEVGALILVVGILHWFFELGLRKEMLREVASTAGGSAHVHECGLDTCCLNARDVDEHAHWSQSANLRIGYQYSPSFFKNFHEVFRERCRRGLPTTVAILKADGAAARYLHDSTTGNPTVRQSVAEIVNLFREIDPNGDRCKIPFHDRVLRYSFIQTDECVWIKFYANSPERTTVPAFKVRADTPLFNFFADDIKRLLEHCRGN